MNAVIGKWAFVVGLVLAVIAGLIAIPYIAIVLAILGLVVGFLNVSAKETSAFLLAGIALTIGASSALNAIPGIGPYITGILTNLVVLVVPGILVVALKSVFSIAKER